MKTWFIEFDGDPNLDGNIKPRLVSGSKFEPSDFNCEVIEMVKKSEHDKLKNALEHAQEVLSMEGLTCLQVEIALKDSKP